MVYFLIGCFAVLVAIELWQYGFKGTTLFGKILEVLKISGYVVLWFIVLTIFCILPLLFQPEFLEITWVRVEHLTGAIPMVIRFLLSSWKLVLLGVGVIIAIYQAYFFGSLIKWLLKELAKWITSKLKNADRIANWIDHLN
jgi:hypothetical protein